MSLVPLLIHLAVLLTMARAARYPKPHQFIGECWRSAKGCLGNDVIYVYGQIPGKTELLCYSFKPYVFLPEACTDPESSWDCVKVNISPGECLEGRIPIREYLGHRAVASAGIWYN